jgi:hypothetical protein
VLFSIGYKNALGLMALVIMFAAYGIQLWKTTQGKSEPHPIAWFGFGLLTGVGYLVQWQKGAGPGGWVMGVTALFCFLVAGLSQYKRRWQLTDFDKWDWGAMLSGVGLFLLYIASRGLSSGPLVSAILATSADLALYIPIFKRAWMLPRKEVATAYGLNGVKFLPSLFAMENYSVETLLYPTALFVTNLAVVVYLRWRRRCVPRRIEAHVVEPELLQSTQPLAV